MLIKEFERQVKETPHNLVVKTVKHQLTYQQLNNHANVVASEIGGNINKQEVVALLFEQGVDMIVSVLGALKAKKIYLPLSPDYPKSRLQYMLENSGAKQLITNHNNMELAEELKDAIASLDNSITLLNIDDLDYSQSLDDPIANSEEENKDSLNAYILYTSGSTGVPKGILQNCNNVYYYTNSYADCISLNSKDRMTLFSSFSHDAAIIDIFSGLLRGACLYPVNPRQLISMEKLAQWLREEEITIWHSIPTLYRCFVNDLVEKDFPRLRLIVLGGENVLLRDVEVARRYFPTACFMNLYGQSEASFNSYQWISPEDSCERVTLGNVIKGTEILLVGEDGMEVEPLNIGEIVIASRHVALGYWRDIEKNNQAFSEDEELGRLYWTGDLGRLLLDGTIEYIGRKDFQLKIRGYRVELGEIENTLSSHPQIKEAVVVGKGIEKGEASLQAFVTSNEELDKKELKDYLTSLLPEYMIPAKIHQIEELPRTANGKTDRGKLLEMNLLEASKEFVGPQNEVEEKISSIWQEALQVETVDVRENFFDIGGDSLMLIQIHSKLSRIFPNKLTIGDLFVHTTVEKLAKEILKEQEKEKAFEIKSLSLPNKYFHGYNPRESFGIFAITLDGSPLQALKEISLKDNIVMNRLLGSIFSYVLAETAKEKTITLHTILNERNIVVAVTIELSNIHNLSQLFQQVSEKMENSNLESIYNLQQLEGLKIPKKDYEIIPLCYDKKKISMNLLNNEIYDLMFEIDEGIDQWNCKLIYNEKRLVKERIKEFLNKIVKVIKLLEENIKKVD